MKKLLLRALLPICLLLGQNGIVSAQETFDESAIYQRMYRLLAQPGEDPNGATDISYIDQGTSDFIRNLFWLNDGAADNAVCGWGDAGLHEIITNTWDHTLPQLDGMFQRLALDIYTCNFYLENAPESQTQRRAEAKFLRALCYYYMLDLFGSVPISTSTVSSILSQRDFWRRLGYNTQREVLPQNSREEVFNFVESELLACAGDLAAPGTATYGHADRAAAWFLLARLYLNAEVYTGTAKWQKAQEYAQKVIDSNVYRLCADYSYLFMGDNDTNGAQNEVIMPLVQSGNPGSWSGTTFLIAACYDGWGDMGSNGLNQRWAGLRARKSLVEKFTGNDKRSMFFSTWHTLEISDLTNFYEGYAVTKWTNVRSDNSQPTSTNYADTDLPLFRYAEMLLTAAEADARQNGGTTSATGTALVNQLRSRANAQTKNSYTLAELSDEWCREFYFEGQRRPTLIRFGKYTGSSYLWDWKGGVQTGQAIDSYRALFPLPNEFMRLSEDYAQNTGYKDPNKIKLSETFTLNTPPYASNTLVLRDYKAMELTWLHPEVTGADASEIIYSIQLSPTGKFQNWDDEDYDPTATVNIGIGSPGTYMIAEASQGTEHATVEMASIEQLLISFYKLKRLSDLPAGQTYDIYVRCVATAAFSESKSNIVKLTVMPYVNNVNTNNYYLLGAAIANGSGASASVAGIGQSMIPMNIDYDTYGSGTSTLGSGVFSKTAYIEAGKTFFLSQLQAEVKSSDGSIEGAQFVRNNTLNEFSLQESGWYLFMFNPQGFWEEDGPNNWVNKGLLKAEKVAAPGNNYQSVKLAGDVNVTLQPSRNDNNRDWYARFTTDKDIKVHFVADGTSLGSSCFSFGVAETGGNDISVPAGSYVVMFDGATGFFDFFDVNIDVPYTGNFNKLIANNAEPVADGKLQVESVNPIDMANMDDEDLIQVCDIVQLPSGASIEALYLVIGDKQYAINPDGTIDAKTLEEAIRSAQTSNRVNVMRKADTLEKSVEAYVYAEYMEDGLSSLKLSNSFTITVLLVKKAYYYIGGMTGWSTADKSWKFSTTDGNSYSLEVPEAAAGNYFCIAEESNFDTSDFWSGEFIGPMDYTDINQLSGYFYRGSGSSDAWQLPALPEGYHFYNLTFDLNAGTYEFIPLMVSGIQDMDAEQGNKTITVYSLSGQRLNSDLRTLSPGIYIVNGRKVMVK